MKRITFEKSDCKQETTFSWLIALVEFGKRIDFLEPLKNFWLKLKGVDYSVFQ